MDWFRFKARGRCQSWLRVGSEWGQSSGRVKYHLRDIVLRACCEHGVGGLEVGTAELVQFATIGV